MKPVVNALGYDKGLKNRVAHCVRSYDPRKLAASVRFRRAILAGQVFASVPLALILASMIAILLRASTIDNQFGPLDACRIEEANVFTTCCSCSQPPCPSQTAGGDKCKRVAQLL
jgi:hypothetical protein